ncbi:ATP-binding protein [Rhizobium sp. AG855]|uniref:sensor histidine kinase n=1 Tax=Rhizobium sp. AG855 TaxID=2183898 RepID=UPI000FF1F675|nr:ATP-binding protein [Rhizobium sp. AG855]RKE83865.1 two-component system C4-dicarboxylate transport sensor histidine kinase DctB [Rhizobium sp. AG855]
MQPRHWIIFILISGAMLLAGVYFGEETFRQSAVTRLAEETKTDAELKRALLLAVLDRSRSLPLVLSEDPDLARTLTGENPTDIARLNGKLQRLAENTHASAIYVIRGDGMAIAASNWNRPDSFVGSNYGFRDYFSKAFATGSAEQYALGSVSRRPGLYLSRRIASNSGAPLGVVVIKVEFEELEESWRRSGKRTFVTDSHGIVLITGVPAWRFLTLFDIPPRELSQIRDSLQFGEAPLTPIPIWKLQAFDGDMMVATDTGAEAGAPHQTHFATTLAVPGTSWALHVLAPATEALDSGAWEGRLVVISIGLPLIAAAAGLLYLSGRAARRRAAEQAALAELERQVGRRTLELTEARDRLQAEIAEHRATDIRLQGVQQDLVQANRLAILGQVAAGVAHEINQPVATIRAYADNAKSFLDRGNAETAKDNLGLISDLTDRIGAITGELKGLARKGRQTPEPVGVKAAIDGALFLLKSRFAGSFDRLTIGDIPQDVTVFGQRIRLEQVLINLLQNALEAIEGQEKATISIGLARLSPDEVDLTVSDTGPGLPDRVRDNLFIPFTTSKEGGLGLGLVIARDIVTEYGGRLAVDTGPMGTTFTITLKRAST